MGTECGTHEKEENTAFLCKNLTKSDCLEGLGLEKKIILNAFSINGVGREIY
jgi:hypothetical protein